MSKHEKYTRLKRQIGLCLAMGVALFSAAPMAFAATSVVANNQLPTGGTPMHDTTTITPKLPAGSTMPQNPVMDITQTVQNEVIKWHDFSIGGSATVNFKGPDRHNTLNYVVGTGNISQIYGTINANNNGNIYIVNPAGVQIGNSAQINVGSLYVSTNTLDDNVLNNFYQSAGNPGFKLGGKPNIDAELMSLGNINANNVTFEGDGRIVIDTERIKDVNGDNKLRAEDIVIHTADTDKLILGYDAYVDDNGYNHSDANKVGIATVYENGIDKTNDVKGYMWVEDIEQLQAINTNLGGNYALRNSIDATATSEWNNGNGFSSLGDSTTAFFGKFDGLGYNIFGLTINSQSDNTGLFGHTDGAIINNVTLVGGSVNGTNNVGAIVGNANNTHLTNVVNSAAITGMDNVGGIVGSSTDSVIKDAVNTGTIEGTGGNVGGLIGSMGGSQDKSQLIGNSYNLGNVSGDGHNVGGLVGYAQNSTIGNETSKDKTKETEIVYNVLDVTGAYNVGGIVGNMENSTVQNAENRGNVTATGSTTELYKYHKGQLVDGPTIKDDQNKEVHSFEAQEEVRVANVGGIVGNSLNGTINDVLNEGDISTVQNTINNDTYYIAGNVGGVVGRAEDTNITNATNKEANIRGAHNVGGIAGYFGNSDTTTEPSYTVTNGINNGGDILATSARDADDNVVKELVRGDSNKENFNIGNMGGIVGYMYGDKTHITGSANRGTVHSADIEDFSDIKDSSKAANVGGIVGKIDRSETNNLNNIKKTDDEGREVLITENIAVSNSYNTGDVKGFTGIGGVVGMMYNGEVAGSYNLGAIESTRIANDDDNNNIDPLNMGGVIGDATERAGASALIYDVYNKGQIGRADFETYGRHVGGVVGRLSGNIEKAYNNGAIYNGYTTTGGIAGWWVDGSITNVFNTGNITVYDKSTNTGTTSQVGGIAGAVELGTTKLCNAYNLGTLRSIKSEDTGITENSLGGIIGDIRDFYEQGKGNLNIENVYTMGNLYVDSGNIDSIIGKNDYASRVTKTNTYYIKPEDGSGFTDLSAVNVNKDDSNKAIEYDKRTKLDEYKYTDNKEKYSLIFSNQEGNSINSNGEDWRIYEGSTTPILNAFIPNTEKYFSTHTNNDENNISSIQYGTAYDPLLTIVNAKGDVQFDWQELGMSGDAGLAVYDGGLTLDNFANLGGTGFFGGIIYTDKALNINGNTDIRFGSSSQIYGSSVNISTTGGDIEGYGNIIATGNQQDSSNQALGDISLSGNNINIYGTLQSSQKGDATTIAGIENTAHKHSDPSTDDPDDIKWPDKDMVAVEDRYAHKVTSSVNGNITITANNGDANIYYGNEGKGLITSGGDLTVSATGDVYVDSDLDIGGNMTLTSTGKDGEVLLTLTNIGKVQADRITEAVESAINGQEITSNNKDTLVSNILTAVGKVEGITEDEAQKIANALISSVENGKTTIQAVDELNETIAVEYMHDFMHSFNTDTHNRIDLNVKESGSAKLTVDMWDDGAYDFKKYDNNNHTFQAELNNLKFYINGEEKDAKDFVYVEVSNGEQLKGIQAAGKDALGYNYALMGDINASGVKDYEAIGTGSTSGFTGTFDGRGNRIIGLNVNSDQGNAGIFDTVGEGGTVKDVNIYSGNFTGASAAGAVAGVNKGRIEGVVTFGNTVTSDGNAGGIAGMNEGKGNFDEDGLLTGSGVYDVESTGSVIAGSNTVAGGLVGTNKGSLGNSYSDSAVTVTTGITTSSGLGGVVGSNTGDVQFVDSLGVTNGGATGSSNVGGIIGINEGKMYSGYNESIVSGQDNVGGIIGKNGDTNTVEGDANTVENVVNATSVDGNDYVGGLVGSNGGSVTNGRNNGEINGKNYVGGLVGSNSADSTLTNLVNDSSAAITGEKYVGGIAGSNAGEINANIDGLTNDGTISGVTYVGGIAGSNTGKIQNTHNNVTLNVNIDALGTDETAQYFGGVVGINQESGIIGDATNTADVNANGAEFVGGIVGHNKGTLENMAGNTGNVIGKDYVGGVAGKNDQDLDGVDASNTGMVHATNGGAGGIFAENSGHITNSILTNNAIVAGTGTTGATGGIIGVNSGDITYSSLKNEVNGQVVGMNNVGGLIGQNSGDIIGGRDTGDGYYKYQIYNNGVIQVGIWNDNNGDHVVDNGELLGGQGSNIGGLFGINTGKVTAAYNTGAIQADDSSNVGGIAGQNSGTIDQVFSTIFDDNGNAGKVVGSTNVGGLVGWNTGVLSNAYNTSQVIGTNTVGNLVGQNDKAVKNVYATVTGLLIGNGSLAQNGYVAEDTQEWKDHGLYDGFDFDNDGGSIWKNYDGYGTPLLKVFLTKAFYDPATGQLVSAADGFNAHYNAAGGLIFHGMGTESNYLWSEQIGFGNGNPNWLGYDLVAMPDIPAWEFPGGRWDYLYSDAPFDRNRDFRERKAEINFVDGGMEL